MPGTKSSFNECLSTLYTCCCSVTQSCLTLCDPMDCSRSGFPVLHNLLEFAQIHVHWISDVIQPSLPQPSPSPPAFNLSQHQGLFQWVGSLHHVAKALEFHLQHQSFQWIFRVHFLWSEVNEVKVSQSCLTLCYPWPVQSMEFSRQEYWSGLPFPSPGIFPIQGSNQGLPHCRQ